MQKFLNKLSTRPPAAASSTPPTAKTETDFAQPSTATAAAAAMNKVAAMNCAMLEALLKDQGVSIPNGMQKSQLVDLVTFPLTFRRVRADIQHSLDDDAHDDGSYIPLLIRFAWHSSGTYDARSNTGGSDGGTIWRAAESADPENAGLAKARTWLKQVHSRHPWITLADLAILAAYVAIEASGGPHIPFCWGRCDFTDEEAIARNGPSGCPFGDGKFNPNGSRLPPADLGPIHGCPRHAASSVREKATIDAMRGTFARMGFGDRATVNLIILGHQFGRCHPEVSGYEHPWYVFGPTGWNVYANGLGYISLYNNLGGFSEELTTGGKRQFNFRMGGGEPFMMLPTDMALAWDESYRKQVFYYDRNRLQFRADARENFKRLTELGVACLLPEQPCAPPNDHVH